MLSERYYGYQTGFFGKWHFGGIDATAGAGFAGFDRWVSLIGQGTYWPFDLYGNPSFLNVDGDLVPQKGYITDELTEYATDWLDSIDKSKPFFLYFGHKGVHEDFQPALRDKGKLNDISFPLPASAINSPENNQGKPMWVQNQRNSWHGIEYPYNSNPDMQQMQRDYYETLLSVDYSIGELRAYLKKHDLNENTIIMVMGDNGFVFGEHGLIDKRTAYEESMRIPLIASGPGFDKGQVVDDIVANIDIAATLLDAAGIKIPSHYDGSSFFGLERGLNQENRKDYLAYEYLWEYNFPYTPTLFAIRTTQYKYIQPYGIWDKDELYDIESDPQERFNLIDSKDPALINKKVELRSLLFQALKDKEGNNAIPYTEKLMDGQVFRHMSAPKMADFPNEWLRDYSPNDSGAGFIPDGVNKDELVKARFVAKQNRQRQIDNYFDEQIKPIGIINK